MPTYEYRCKACGQELEVVQSFTDDALTTCAACGGPLRKVFGNVGIAFKGSGFYKNDSRGKATASATSTDKSSEAGSSSADKGGAGADAGSPTKSDGAAASTPAPTPKADTAKTSATTT